VKVADPEQMYQEVLEEERQKGSSPAVAEGRAKAARVRAELGSPHPKEPKWWPGAQPHLEGEEAVAAEAPAAEAPAEEAPAEEAPAEEAPAEEAAPPAEPAPVETAPQPAAEAPAEPPAEAPAQPAAEAPAQPEATTAPPAPEPAPQVAAEPAAQAPPARPAGVIHGTTTGTRLRPEDVVTTEAAFEGQQAMYQRRKVIDELLATGVPEVTGVETGPRGGFLLAILYIAIPLIAIAILAAQENGATEAEPGGGGGGDGATADATVVAESTSFDTEQITLPADQEVTIAFENRDAVQHNIAIYENEEAEQEIFVGELITGPDTVDYAFETPEPGEYFFRCDVHPTEMTGTVEVQ
jgi:plastocyanin